MKAINRAFSVDSTKTGGASWMSARLIRLSMAPATDIPLHRMADEDNGGTREHPEVWHPQGQSGAADSRAAAEVGVAHLGQFALLYPGHRRPYPELSHPAPTGNAALHRRRLSGRGYRR